MDRPAPLNVAPQPSAASSATSVSTTGTAASATPRHQYAADWLISIGPKLANFREQDRALAELHSAHVDAWLDAESCGYCGELVPSGTAKRGNCHICPACALKHPEDEYWRVEGAMRKRAEARS